MAGIREAARWYISRPHLFSDGVIALLLAIFFSLGSRSATLVGLDRLFLCTYAALALGLVFFYLLLDVNPKLAFFAHVVAFPFVSFFYLFLRWLPDISGEALLRGSAHQLFGSILVYVVLLIGFLLANFYLYLRGVEKLR